MKTNVRTFLRQFSGFKARARRGETVRIQDKGGEFLFTATTPGRSLLGAAQGKITVVQGDLTAPTLSPRAWKASL